MTVAPPEIPAAADTEPESPGKYRWGPLWAHAIGLLLVLLAFLPYIGTEGLFTSDEGAALAQAEMLDSGEGWTMSHPLPQVDPSDDGEHFPFVFSSRSDDQFAPFAKHPLYVIVLWGSTELAGSWGSLLVSVLGTWLAAVLGALIARHIDRQLDLATLWVIGLASPLLFDSYQVVAHSLGAAGAAACALALINLFTSRRPAWLAGALVALAFTVLLRNEGVLYGIAAALVIAAEAARRRDLLAGLTAGGMAVMSALMYLVTARLEGWVMGGEVELFAIQGAGGGFVGSRMSGLYTSVLRATTSGIGVYTVAVFIGLVSLVCAAWLIRTRPAERGLIRFCAVLGAVGFITRMFVGPPSTIPGLAMAFPAGVAAALLVRRRHLTGLVTPFLLWTSAVYALGVMATQYANGGGAQWGGRYFHLILPLVVPVLVLALRDGGRALDRGTWRTVLASFVSVSVALGVMALRTHHHNRYFTAAVVQEIATVSDRAAGSDSEAGPVVITNMEHLGRLAWDETLDGRWLWVDDDSINEVAANLAEQGVEEFTFAAPEDAEEDLAAFEGRYEVVGEWHPPEIGSWTVALLRARPP